MAQALAACQSTDSVLEETYHGVSRLLGVHDYYVTLYDAEADEATLVMAVVDREVEWPRVALSAGELGLAQRLIASREPLLLPDRVPERAAELGASVLPLRPGQDALSWLGVPMLIRGQVLGAMVAQSYTISRAHDQHSQVLLTAVANQTAIALENVRLLQDTQEALAKVQSTQRTYLQRAWHDHLRQREMLGRSGFLYDQVEAERQEDAVPSPELWRPEIERAVAEGSPVVVQDGDADRERAGLAVPITLRGQTLGVIGVEAPAGDRQWTEDDIAFVEAISEQLGQALESARLFADTQRRAERERLVGEITSRIRASTDIQAILEATAEELGQVLGTSRALVRVTAGEQLARQQDRSPPADDPGPANEGQRE
jgi:GAF domain-containing protein